MSDNPKGNSKTWVGLLLGTALALLIGGNAVAATDPRPMGATPDAAGREAQKLVADGQEAIKNGSFQLALMSFTRAVRTAPSNAAAHLGLGIALSQLNDLSGAEKEMRLALKVGASRKTVLPYLLRVMVARKEYEELLKQFPDPDPKSPAAPETLKGRALAFQRLGHGPEALNAADRALDLRRDAVGLLARASLSLEQGDASAANRFADEAVKLSPGNLEIAMFKLTALRALKDNDGAMALSNQLLKKFPDNLQVQFAHIELLLDQKQDARAKAEVDAILAKQPENPTGIYFQALLKSRAGDARGAWDLALTLQKEPLERSPQAALMIAQMAVNADHREAAAGILGNVLRADSGNRAARLRLASLYLDQGNPTSALNVLGPMTDSSDPDAIRLLARVYARLHRGDEAAKTLKRLAAPAGNDAREISRNALANIQAGHLDQAIKDLSQAFAKDSTNPALAGPLIGALLRAHRFADAMAVADKIAADPRQRATAMQYRGEVLAEKRDLAGAEAAFGEAIKLAPDNRIARLARAGVHMLAKKYDDADRDLRVLLTRDPRDAPALLMLADIAMRQGHDADVRSNLAKAIASSPQELAPRLALARYLADRGDFKGGLQQASAMVGLQPSNPVALELQGMLQQKTGQKSQAVASFRRLVAQFPKAAGPQAALGDALFQAGDRAGATKALDAAVALAPGSAAIRTKQINLQLAMGQADQAVLSSRAFRNANPGPESDLLAADVLARTKHADQALELLSNSYAGKPSRDLLMRYGRLAVSQNQTKRAEEALTSWLQKNPADTGARLEFAGFYLGQNDPGRAIPLYEAVLKRDPNNALALNNLGGLIQTSNPGRAATLLTKAVTLMPDSPDANDSLGWLKVQQKDAAGGLVYLRKAHNVRPQDAGITYRLIVALDADAKRDEARALLKSLLSSGAAFPDKQAALKLSSQWR